MPDQAPPLLYARCWEDADVLRAALRAGPGDHVLSIGSAGDNTFALLLDDPERVVCLDRSPAQLALIHLKIACLRHLEPSEARRFLGAAPAAAAERLRTYQALRSALPAPARAVWDRAPQVLTGGVLHAGKFERYLAAFRDRVLPRVQSRDVIRAMAGSTDPAAQRELFDRRWNSWRWRLLFRLFFSRAVMERRGRQREFFEHVEGRVADRFLARAEWALTAIPVATNPYLVWILDGTERAPAYLREPEAQRIRERLDRLVIVQDDLTGHLAGARGAYHAHNYHAHNLSDCAEYLPPDAADALLRAVVAASQPGARVCYWNLLVPRDGARVPGLASEEALAAALHARDRAFFYSRLVVERVTG